MKRDLILAAGLLENLVTHRTPSWHYHQLRRNWLGINDLNKASCENLARYVSYLATMISA